MERLDAYNSMNPVSVMVIRLEINTRARNGLIIWVGEGGIGWSGYVDYFVAIAGNSFDI